MTDTLHGLVTLAATPVVFANNMTSLVFPPFTSKRHRSLQTSLVSTVSTATGAIRFAGLHNLTIRIMPSGVDAPATDAGNDAPSIISLTTSPLFVKSSGRRGAGVRFSLTAQDIQDSNDLWSRSGTK
jgi:hypothetical protein